MSILLAAICSPAGTIPSSNATECVECTAGTYSFEGSPKCEACPVGSVAIVEGQALPAAENDLRNASTQCEPW